MDIQVSSKNLSLSEEQKDYIEKKAEKLLHYSKRADDESSRITVDVNSEGVKDKKSRIHCIVNVFIPQSTLHAESYGQTPQAAMDQCEEKLKVQVEKYKGKVQHA